MEEAAPIYKSLSAEEKARYIKIAEGQTCSPLYIANACQNVFGAHVKNRNPDRG